jgi:Zn-dependent protease with chaperone function
MLTTVVLGSSLGREPVKGTYPSSEEVARLLGAEPFSLQTWPAWRQRLLDWMGDKSRQTDAAYQAARDFTRQQASHGELTGPLANDALAWYFLGSAYLFDEGKDKLGAAEQALRRSIQLDPAFARAHRNLALTLMRRQDPKDTREGFPPAEARRELDEARRLDPSLPLKVIEGQGALEQVRFAQAETLFREALQEDPDDRNAIHGLAAAIAFRPQPDRRAPAVKALVDRLPDDGILRCLYAIALANDGDSRAALHQIEMARSLGVDPNAIIGSENLKRLEQDAAPGWLEQLGWVMLYFAGFYAVVMALMAGVGVLLANRTRGLRALSLLGESPEELVSAGQVVRTGDESTLARWYGYALVAALVLFYAAIPFVLAGLVAGTLLLLYLVFFLPRIPVKLILIVVVVGGGAAWAVLKSIFARPPQGSFGIPKTREQVPRLYQALAEVAQRVDTDPVDQVYLAPGSAIGVHQEGRGPFGMFGVKQRVLTLGLSTMNFLTIGELKAILAHEYAHFSHKDTFYNRFIYQVTLTIEQSLAGMGATGGIYNYVNPFYWFLYLYYKCFHLLSAGFSRSREFLADRMAATLYGSDVFASALTKVSTDGTLFEMTVYDNISQLLEANKVFVNMYAAFRDFRNQHLAEKDRQELYQKLLDEKASLFASHPTFGERIEAVANLAKAGSTASAPALELFEEPEELEKELTEFLTAFLHHVRQLQAAAAAQ